MQLRMDTFFHGRNKMILKPIELSNEAEARQGPVTWNMVLPVDFQVCTGSFHIERISRQTHLERPPMIMSAFTQEILLLVAAVQPCHVWHIQNRGQATPKTRLAMQSSWIVSVVYSSLDLPSSTSRGKVSEVPPAMWCSSVQWNPIRNKPCISPQVTAQASVRVTRDRQWPELGHNQSPSG